MRDPNIEYLVEKLRKKESEPTLFEKGLSLVEMYGSYSDREGSFQNDSLSIKTCESSGLTNSGSGFRTLQIDYDGQPVFKAIDYISSEMDIIRDLLERYRIMDRTEITMHLHGDWESELESLYVQSLLKTKSFAQ